MSTEFFQNTATKNLYSYWNLLLNNHIINTIIEKKALYNKILFTYIRNCMKIIYEKFFKTTVDKVALI